MSQYVTVCFGSGAEYEFHLSGADTAGLAKDEARKWLHEEFDNLECTPSNPMGKVLVLDVILNVAKYGGEERFKAGGEWARKFAIATAVVLDRPAIKVDVVAFVVG